MLTDIAAETDAELPGLQPADIDEDTQIHFFDNISNADGWTTGKATIVEASIHSRIGESNKVFAGGERVRLQVRVDVHETLSSPIVGFLVKDRLGQELFGENTYPTHPGRQVQAGHGLVAEFDFALPMLLNGTYSVTVAIADGSQASHVQHHWLHDAIIVRIASTKPRHGIVCIPFERVELKNVESHAPRSLSVV